MILKHKILSILHIKLYTIYEKFNKCFWLIFVIQIFLKWELESSIHTNPSIISFWCSNKIIFNFFISSIRLFFKTLITFISYLNLELLIDNYKYMPICFFLVNSFNFFLLQAQKGNMPEGFEFTEELVTIIILFHANWIFAYSLVKISSKLCL